MATMDKEVAARIITHAVETTRSRWAQFDRSWRDIDRIFIHHGYEQGGFEIFRFLPLLEERGAFSIEALGSIGRADKDPAKYDRAYAGSLEAPFYRSLREGDRGEAGLAFYDSIGTFLASGRGRPGRFFWRLMWFIPASCRYLRQHHGSSFAECLRSAYARYRGTETASDDELLALSAEDWSGFLDTSKPWKPLLGIGRNTFDFILGDIVEARFAGESYKLDSANGHFLKVTGIAALVGILDRDGVIAFLRSLELPFPLRQVNKGIYTYCSITEAANFGFCRNPAKCRACGVFGLCEKRIGE